MKFKSGIAAILLLSAAVSHGAEPLFLVRDGVPQSVIVLGEKPTRSAQLGAFELQHHIKLITGAELPIVKEKSSPAVGTVIKIGGENGEAGREACGEVFGQGRPERKACR